jgi:hypothetical protein
LVHDFLYGLEIKRTDTACSNAFGTNSLERTSKSICMGGPREGPGAEQILQNFRIFLMLRG